MSCTVGLPYFEAFNPFIYFEPCADYCLMNPDGDAFSVPHQAFVPLVWIGTILMVVGAIMKARRS